MNLKIGIDYHGVITDNPAFFREFNTLALQKGIRIYILSGGRKAEIQKYLLAQKIPYSEIFSILDFYDAQHKVSFLADGSFKVDDDLWNKAKAQFCLKEGIAFHIDDSPLYGETFETPFCLYNNRSQSCQSTGISIDFKQSAPEVLEHILKHIVV